MDKSDFKEFGKIFMVLVEIHSKELSPGAIEAYFNVLLPYDKKDVISSINQAIVKCKWFPKPVELIEMITGGDKQLEDVAEIQALKVIEATKKYGSYKNVAFADPITQRIVSKQFGWGNLCAMDEKNISFFIRDFKSAYLSLERSGECIMIEAPDEMLKLTENIG